MGPTKVILLSCGSYNPPTNMHFRMFEIARDHIHKMGSHVVIGGVISPVHDSYGKKDLAPATHRCAMLRLALQNNDWIKLSDWETRREGWTKTRVTLQHHQNLLNSLVFDNDNVKHHFEIEDMEWIPDKIKNSASQDQRSPIQVKLLCGADLLESFGTPGLWAEEDIDAIVGQHGLVVVTREGSNPNQFIYDSDLLSKYMHNIIIVTEWITNEISSTKIRRALKRGESAKYLVQDSVLDYIYKHGIYDAQNTSETKLEICSSNTAINYLNIDTKYNNAFLTPSPSDITMETPSPVEIISIDIPDSILRKNYLNNEAFATNTVKIPTNKLDDNDKFIGIMSENGNNKILHNMKNAYPGQAKQIIATETGESHILEEVGSSYDVNNQSLIIDTNVEPIGEDCSSVIQNSGDLTVDKNEDHVIKIINQSKDDDSNQTAENNEAQDSTTILPNSNLEVESVAEDCQTKIQDNESTINSTNSEEREEKLITNKETLEIDGKYLKSLVNSRKSPKKCKNKDEKSFAKDESTRYVDGVDKPELISEGNLIKKSGKIKEDEATQCEKIDSVNSESQTDLNFDDNNCDKTFSSVSKKLCKISEQGKQQGSLDSVKFNIPNERSSCGFDTASKKSKSFESIKYDSSKSISYKSFEISLSDTLKPKSDSTSKLITATNFCSECCYENNENFLSDVSLNQETFYTVQSNGSTPVEEDLTECDICSACNLDSTEILEEKSISVNDKCDLCEICNDINADFEGDLVMPYPEIETDDVLAPNYDSDFTLIGENESDRFEIENCGLEEDGNVINYGKDEECQDFKKRSVIEEVSDNLETRVNNDKDNDDFEIENCGLDNKVRNIVLRDSCGFSLKLLKNDTLLNFESNDFTDDYQNNQTTKNLIYSSNESVKYSAKFTLPKYVPKKISRKGSFIIKDSGCKTYQDKRRYSSVDNLQNSKQAIKLSDRVFQKSKGNKLIASADNIQTNKVNKNLKLKKLQKSANDIDSLAEKFDSLTENFTLSENDLLASDNNEANLNSNIKIRDSDMVKMILTKHGIKIISEKETAL